MLCIQLRSWAWNMKHDFTWFYEALGLPFECWTCWPGWFQRPSDEFWDWQCTKKTGVFTSEGLVWNDFNFESWLLRWGSYCAAYIGNVHRSIHNPETSCSGADSNSKYMHYRSHLFIFSYYICWLSFRTWFQLLYLFFQLLRLGCWSFAPEWGFEYKYSTVEFLLQCSKELYIDHESWGSSFKNVASFLPPFKISQDCRYLRELSHRQHIIHSENIEAVSCVGWLWGTAALDTWTQLKQGGIWWANNSKFYFYHIFGCYDQGLKAIGFGSRHVFVFDFARLTSIY